MSTPVSGPLATVPLHVAAGDIAVWWNDPGGTWESVPLGSGPAGPQGPPGATGAQGPNITTSDTPPASPAIGSGWWDSIGGQLYIWFNDGTSSQWVPSANQPGAQGPAGPIGATGATGPAGSANMSGMVAGQIPIAATATSVTSSVATLAASFMPAHTGDVTSPAGSTVNTLPNVNANPGTWNNVTVNGKGQVTAGSNTAYVTGGPYLPLNPGGNITGTLNVSGNVGIGTVAPGVKLTVVDATQYGGIQLRNASNPVVAIQPQGAGGDNGALLLANGGTIYTVISAAGNSYINGGNLGIGTTVPSKRLSVNAPAAADFVAYFNNTNAAAGDSVIMIAGGAAGSDTTTALLTFYNSAISAWIGGIQRNGASTVAFLTTSDERLKEGIAATKTGLDALMKIKVRDYSYKDDERVEQGILAQELHAIYPIAVHPGGDDPALQPWAIDYGRLTPLLIKVVQELKVEIDILKRKGSS